MAAASPVSLVTTERQAGSLGPHGLCNPGTVHLNLCPAALVEAALARGEGSLTDSGAFVAYTAPYTGRSPHDRFFVLEPSSRHEIGWGKVNQPIEPAHFERLFDKVRAYFQGRELFVADGWACADPRHGLPIRVVAEKAWHALFARCLFRRPSSPELAAWTPRLTIWNACGLKAEGKADGIHGEAFILLDLARGLVVIGGTPYAGEMKKAAFTFLNYHLPGQGVFPMHCSANVGAKGDVALMFGLSGTGKTTLSADPDRRLIGDDEHGWSENGVFNIEGGCYAKTIRLRRDKEPQIWDAIRFGAVLENVAIDPATRVPDYDDESITENTRAAYPLDHIANVEPSGRGGHPRNVVFLTCDAFGVLPPLSRLTLDQSLYHFLQGYTAKVAGTERGVTEPEATFSTCFAAPFLPLPAGRYADLLRERLVRHGSQVWLLNTGWTGGGNQVGERIPLVHTRALLRAALDGSLGEVAYANEPVFGLAVPKTCPGVPAQLLQPRATWSDPNAYDAQAKRLVGLFRQNFSKYVAQVSDGVRQAGPS